MDLRKTALKNSISIEADKYARWDAAIKSEQEWYQKSKEFREAAFLKKVLDEQNEDHGEYDDAFQNQLDYYLEHGRREFNYFLFHTTYPSWEQNLGFERALFYGLKQSGFEVFEIVELFPMNYKVRKIGGEGVLPAFF